MALPPGGINGADWCLTTINTDSDFYSDTGQRPPVVLTFQHPSTRAARQSSPVGGAITTAATLGLWTKRAPTWRWAKPADQAALDAASEEVSTANDMAFNRESATGTPTWRSRSVSVNPPV